MSTLMQLGQCACSQYSHPHNTKVWFWCPSIDKILNYIQGFCPIQTHC